MPFVKCLKGTGLQRYSKNSGLRQLYSYQFLKIIITKAQDKVDLKLKFKLYVLLCVP